MLPAINKGERRPGALEWERGEASWEQIGMGGKSFKLIRSDGDGDGNGGVI